MPSTVGRQIALASGGTTACVTSYSIGALTSRAPSLPGPVRVGVRRGRAASAAADPSVGSTPSKRLLTDSPACTREIASANSSATERIFSSGQSDGAGTVSVVTTSLMNGCSRSRSTALPTNSPCVQATDAPVQPSSRSFSSSSTIEPPVAISSSRTMACLPRTSPTIASITTRSSASRCLLPAATGSAEQAREVGGGLRVAQVGRDDHRLLGMPALEVVASTPSALRWSTGTEKNPCTCGACSVMVSTRLTPRRDQHVGDQPAAERDAGGVLLVRAGVGVVRDHRGDLRGAGALRGVDHQQQLHEVLLGRRHQRLHDVDVALAAVGLQLRLEAVVAEPADLHRGQPHAERVADGAGEGAVGASAEDDDLTHGGSPVCRWDDAGCGRRGHDNPTRVRGGSPRAVGRVTCCIDRPARRVKL